MPTARAPLSRQAYGDLTVVVRRLPQRERTDGPSFVLVHGIAVSYRYFEQAAQELTRYGDVYLVDLPGHGFSPKAHRDVSIADHAGVLADFLAHNALDNPVLVGHSMGAQVVAQLAVDAPQTTDRLVLLAPSLEPRLRTFWRAFGSLLLDATREPWWGNAITASDLFFRCRPPYALAQMKHLLSDRLEDRLGRIVAPTLVVRGERDPIVSAEWAARIAALLPDSTLRTVPGPHVMMFTDPAEVAALIARHAERA